MGKREDAQEERGGRLGNREERREEPGVAESFRGARPQVAAGNFHVLVTTYECVASEATALRKLRWRAAAVGEERATLSRPRPRRVRARTGAS